MTGSSSVATGRLSQPQQPRHWRDVRPWLASGTSRRITAMAHDPSTARLDQAQCWDLLRSTDVGRIAVIVAGRPEIFPVNYAVAHGGIVFRTGAGTKLGAAVAGADVAFEVDHYDRATNLAWSVMLKGRAKVARGFTELLDTTGLPVFPWERSPKSRFVTIVAEDISGRRFDRVDPSHWEEPLDTARPRIHE